MRFFEYAAVGEAWKRCVYNAGGVLEVGGLAMARSNDDYIHLQKVRF
jgi:hypothetical protein